jgi:murein DD-endopeptidase MepM/ murein hydrolase activator NlpD
MKSAARPQPLWIAALGGFVVGAFGVSLTVWYLGALVGSREPERIGQVTSTGHLPDDLAPGRVAVVEHPRTATLGKRVDESPGPAIPSIGADPLSALRDRQLIVPVQGVDRDQLHSSFAEARGANRKHEALDILAPRNTPVVAVDAGRIARLFLSRDGGITVYQYDPTRRYVYYYAHLERYAESLREGDEVRRGQVVGYVGTSGNAPPGTPHLHFAIFKLTAEGKWWDGAPIDPFGVLR